MNCPRCGSIMVERPPNIQKIYQGIADELVMRILDLIPTHPEIMEMDSPWGLFKAGLKCDDLQPTLGQASWALGKAQHEFRACLEHEKQHPQNNETLTVSGG